MREEATKDCGVTALAAEADGRESHLRRGWYWGSQDFAEKALKLGEKALSRGRHRAYAGSLEKKTHDRARAEALLESGLEAAGLNRADLLRLPGADARKVAIARAIWSQTTMPQTWLAEQLEMKSAANVSQLIRRASLSKIRVEPRPKFRRWLELVSKNVA
jgi:putative transposase